MSKVYLGDSVYADFNAIIRGDVILTTENGNGPTNSIYLEPQVIDALNQQRTSLEHNTRATPPVTAVPAKCDDALVDEVQRRMDAVVDAAVKHHCADADWPEAADALSAAIESLLELREFPAPAAEQGGVDPAELAKRFEAIITKHVSPPAEQMKEIE